MKYIDIHSHIFPDNIAAKVVNQLETYYQVKWFGTGELQDLLDSIQQKNITRSVVFSSATKPQQVEPIHNYISGIIRQYPDLFIGFGTMHIDYTNYRDELKRVRDLGLKGLKFHPDFQKFPIDDPRMLKIYEAIGDSLVMLFHVGDQKSDLSSPKRVANVLKEFPHLKIVAAHLGGYRQWDLAKEYLVGKNLWLDTSSCVPLLNSQEAKEIILAHGSDKILFGSDYPACRHQEAVEIIMNMGFSQEDNEKIFYKNAEKLLNIKV